MARYVGSVEIARPPRVVFDFFDTPENTPRYTQGVVSCTQISGVRQGVGTRVLRMTAANARAPIDATEDVLEYVAGSHRRSTGTIGWYAHYDSTTRVEPTEDGGSRVTYEYVCRPTVAAILTIFFWPLFLLLMRGRIERTLETAKRVIESEAVGAYRAAG